MCSLAPSLARPQLPPPQLEQGGMPSEQLEAMRDLVQRLLETLRRSVRKFTERELQTRNHDYMEKFRREMLTEKSFYHLTEDEIRRMREVVVRLAQRIKNILSIRRKRLKKGKLDLHTTLRRNMARGGIPFEVIFKQRRKERPSKALYASAQALPPLRSSVTTAVRSSPPMF